MEKLREQYPISSKIILKLTALSIFRGLIYLAMVVVGILYFLGGFAFSEYVIAAATLGLGLTVLFLIIAPAYHHFYRRKYFYDLADNYLLIRKGLLAPKEIIIPYDNIQGVTIGQDFLDSILRIYNIRIASSDTFSGKEAYISGLEKEIAEGLRTAILEGAKANK